eukprot:scaffold78004_cov60-Phaeocystis_antarctica.AAC.3
MVVGWHGIREACGCRPILRSSKTEPRFLTARLSQLTMARLLRLTSITSPLQRVRLLHLVLDADAA